MVKRLLDLLVIAFIFLNVLAFEIPIAGISARFLVMGMLLVLSVCIGLNYYFSQTFLRFIIPAYVGWFILILYSFLAGNDGENIISYSRPLLMLLMIPSFQYVFCKFGVERYIKALSFACVIMVFIFIFVFARSLADPSYALNFVDEDEKGLISVVKSDLGARVVIKTFVFLVPFAFYGMWKLKGIQFYLFSVAILIIAGLSQTLGVVIPIFLFYFYVLHRRKQKTAFTLSLIALLIILSSATLFINDVLATKEGSADIKTEQVRNLFKDMDAVELLMGRGIGCDFKNFDGRGISEPMIEVAAVQMFQWGGLLFSWIILYIYLIPGIKAMRRSNTEMKQILGLSQAGLFLASMSNPYMWGGTGLLLIVMTVACPQEYKLK